MQHIEIRTNPEYKYDEVLTIINSNFALVSGSSSSFSGGTVSGTTNFLGQILSGDTDLYSIFSTVGSSGSGDVTRVQPGVNIYTGGTGNFPIINLSDSPTINNLYFSGTAVGGNIIASALSGTNIYSGSTNLSDLFATLLQINILEDQILTKANLSGAAFNGVVTSTSLSATTLSGGTILSGTTNLDEIFSPKNTIGGFGITIDGASAPITVGIKGYVIVPFSGQIQSWEILSNVSGNTSIDVLKSTFSSFLTDTGTTITNGDYINLVSNYKNVGTNLSAWTTSFNAGDIFTFNVLSANTINRVNIMIKVIKYN